MLLSVQTGSILDKYGIDEGFRMIAEAGFQAVDVNIDHCLKPQQILANDCHGFYDRPDAEILKDARPYKEAAEKYGLSFTQAHAPFPTFVLNERTNEYVIECIKKTIMICDYLDCRRLVVHSGCLRAHDCYTAQDEWDYNMKMYSELIPALKKYNVVCCLENLFYHACGKVMEGPCSDPHEAIRYVDLLNERAGEKLFGFCLDVGHAHLLGKDLCELIGQLGERICALHIHDNDGIDDRHMFPYMGGVQWERFCRGLKEIHYAYDLSFETFHAMDVFDSKLAPDLLRLLHSTGRLFAGKICGE